MSLSGHHPYASNDVEDEHFKDQSLVHEQKDTGGLFRQFLAF